MHSPVKFSRVKKTKTKNLPEPQDDMSRASCILVGCYGGDSGDNGDGHCGHCTHSPVKKLVELKTKTKKTHKFFYQGLRHVILSLICCLGCYGACNAVVIALVVAGCVKMVVPCFL